MKLKLQPLIFILVFGWIIFIVWGVIKTTLKLTEKKELPQKQTEISAPVEKTIPTNLTPEEGTLQKVSEIPVLVRAFKVKPVSFTDILPVMGTIKADIEVELKFEIEGIIKSINFKEGEKIKKGDIIAQLEPKDMELKLEYARNKKASAKANYEANLKKLETYQKLYEAGAIIKSKLEEIQLSCESSKYEFQTAEAEEKLAENVLKKTQLYAPLDGIMGPREVEEGEFVTPQDKIGSLLKIDSVVVEAGIVERDINKVKVGQNAKVYVDAYPDIVFEGKVDKLLPVVEGKSRTLTAKIKVNNPQRLLIPGMFSRSEIVIIELKDAFIIPSVALIPAGKGMMLVSVISPESIETTQESIQTGIVQLRRVEIGYITSDYVQITKGLYENDLVVLEAQGELQDNTKVHITAIEEANF
ncbi:MAG: efflux RND transporter periplasmic adaptor subunit [Candidatus Omnitrophica bacterium]|nr:efflux RND transporter periplasmic adaptor subunit [Candidatus Omnitrophota bacterium]